MGVQGNEVSQVIPGKNGLGLERSGPAEKPGGFCQGGIGLRFPRRSPKSPSAQTGEPGRLGRSLASKPRNAFGVESRPSRPILVET